MKKSAMKQKPVLGRIVQSIAPYRLTLLIALISGIMYVVLTLWAPVVIGWAGDLLLGTGLVQFGGVVRYLLLLGAMIGLEFVKDPVTKAPTATWSPPWYRNAPATGCSLKTPAVGDRWCVSWPL